MDSNFVSDCLCGLAILQSKNVWNPLALKWLRLYLIRFKSWASWFYRSYQSSTVEQSMRLKKRLQSTNNIKLENAFKNRYIISRKNLCFIEVLFWVRVNVSLFQIQRNKWNLLKLVGKKNYSRIWAERQELWLRDNMNHRIKIVGMASSKYTFISS